MKDSIKISKITIINVGKIFGKLTLLKFTKRVNGKLVGLFNCECGVSKEILFSNVKAGHTVSCGCYAKEMLINRATKHGHSKRGVKTLAYRVWVAMRNRCYNKNHPFYSNYGDIGITVCNKWLGKNGFQNFLLDMGEPPSEKHSIDRINNSIGYSKINCRWATRIEQNSNTKRNRYIIVDGDKMTISQAARIKKIHPHTLLKRLNRGLSDSDAIKPIIKK